VTVGVAATDTAEVARAHWRRQLVLTIAGVTIGGVSLALMRVSISREAQVAVAILRDGTLIRSESYLSTLWPAALGMLGLAVLTVILLVHAYRVAAFTFRRGDP
jgi:hypothetical protein